MDFYGFYTGKVFDAYRYLGGHLTEAGGGVPHLCPSGGGDLRHRRFQRLAGDPHGAGL